MANLQPLLPDQTPRKIPQSVFAPIADAPPVADLSGMAPGPNPLGTIASIAPPPLATVGLDPRAALAQKNSDDLVNRAAADNARLYKLNNPTKPTTTLGKIGHVAANIGDVLGDIFAPGPTSLIPRSQLNNEVEKNRLRADLDQVSKLQQEAAQTKLLDATPELKQQASEIQSLRAQGYLQHVNDMGQHYDQQNDAQLAQHGYKRDAQGRIVPMSYQELSPTLQAVEDLKQSQSELADANKSYADAKAKNLPLQMEMAERRIQIAQQNASTAIRNLQLRGAEYDMHAFGTDASGNPLPGILFDANGNPVGSNQASNIRPTAQERKTGDLAQSAVNQVHVMRTIIKDHPEVFGPIGGRKLSAEQWLGSQSPDAQAFLSASRYLADHSAGVFGSRSVEITKSLEQLTNPNTNPAALDAALDRAESTAQHFVDQGTVPVHPSPKANGGIHVGQKVTLGNGTTITVKKVFPDGSFE